MESNEAIEVIRSSPEKMSAQYPQVESCEGRPDVYLVVAVRNEGKPDLEIVDLYLVFPDRTFRMARHYWDVPKEKFRVIRFMATSVERFYVEVEGTHLENSFAGNFAQP